MHQLETLYLCYGVKCQPGVTWGHSSGQGTCRFCDTTYCLVLLLLSVNMSISQTCYIHIDQTWPKWPVPWPLLAHKQLMGSKVTMGSLGSKRSFSPKMLFLLQITWYGHVTHAYWSARHPTKVIGLKNYPGSFGVTGVKRSFSPKLLFLLQITWYGHVTHAYWSARHPSTKVIGLKMSFGVIWGHRGSKGHFNQKCYFSYRLHGMVMWLIHIHQLDTLYLCCGVKCQPGVIWGHWGQKVIFTKNAIISYILHGMVMWLMHIHQLDTLYLCCGVKYQPGVIWGHWGQRVVFTKNAL